MHIAGNKKLINILIDNGKVKKKDLEKYADSTNFEVEKKLQSEKIVSEKDIAYAYATLHNLPFVALGSITIPKNVLELVPENLAQTYKIIPYSLNEKKNDSPEIVKIAIAEPSKLTDNLKDILDQLEQKKNFKIELAITTIDDFIKAVSQYKTVKQPLETPIATTQVPINAPKVQYKSIDLDKVVIPYDVITKFPLDIAEKYQMVVFEAPHPSFIKVAVVDPEDYKIKEILNFIKEKNEITIEIYKIVPSELQRALRFYEKQSIPKVVPQEAPKVVKIETTSEIPELQLKDRGEQEKIDQPKIEKPQEKPPEKPPEKPIDQVPEVMGPKTSTQVNVSVENDLDKFLNEKITEVDDLSRIAETGHVPKIVAAAIVLAVAKKASDIHIEPGIDTVRLRFRVDGLLHDIIKLPISFHPAIISRIKIMSKLKIDETRIPQDGRFDVIATGHAIDLRISTLPTVHGEKVAMRLLDKSAHLYTLEELGMTGKGLKILLENMNKPYGVILSTGPTGSGKTTTLYAILTRISNASVNIITLEDPVEYEMAGLNQCQIKPKIGFTFANGLRSVLRQDPNIIMVGEIRDSETAALSTHAALTGHLVLSTLHTNDAAGALPRLTDMGVEPFFITSLINAIIGQRLVRKLCPKCKRPAHIPSPIIKQIELELERFHMPKPYNFFEGAGCAECELGYSGRIGIFEVLTMSPRIESLVLAKKPASEVKREAEKDGMVTMKQDGLLKALKGQTTVSEVLRVITV